MSEKRRYRHPITNKITYTDDPFKADLLGLEPWDGDIQEVEQDKVTGIEYAVIDDTPDYRSIQSELKLLGLSAKGSKEELIERLAEAKSAVVSGDLDTTLHGDSADGDTESTDPQKEG